MLACQPHHFDQQVSRGGGQQRQDRRADFGQQFLDAPLFRDRSVHPGGGIGRRVFVEAADEPERFRAGVVGKRGIGGHREQAADVFVASRADHGVEDTEIDGPCGFAEEMGRGGEVRARSLDHFIVDRLHGFDGDGEVAVFQEDADARVLEAAERQHHGAAHGGGFEVGESEDGIGITDPDHALDRAVADVFVLVVVLLDDGHQRGDLLLGSEFSDRDGGEHSDHDDEEGGDTDE